MKQHINGDQYQPIIYNFPPNLVIYSAFVLLENINLFVALIVLYYKFHTLHYYLVFLGGVSL